MRILIVGGTGLISSELAALAADRGDSLTLINRGNSPVAPPPEGAEVIHADATDAAAMRAALRGRQLRGERFDAVVQCVAFTPEHVAEDAETFARLTDQYVLIATGASYRTAERFQFLTEETGQENLHWEYARLKLKAEQVLRASEGLPWTIVRPAHTYGPSKIPAYTGNSRHPWTIVDRMRRGADILIPGDGTALWTITHARDVAAGILGLLGNADAIGTAVHITSDEALTWTGLYREIARAAGLSDEQFESQKVCVPSDALVAAAPSQAGSIYGDKMHSAVYDTSRIAALVPGWSARIPFDEGVAEAISWFEAHPDRQTVDENANAMFDRLGAIYRRALADAGA
ncbi:NAD-dependent epimerase/dehydratase family protein [Demequina muriae]|uniref:NAD-dependent epimerase/dehydratase family protein n=1 Tax=Demequina muriae TaxID=3051664 RepID=A0ABT8GDA6_9MICO|nr:NAD-dependent epimerase/dehydratase family protein [Demequina sp. EGI L300058]MDN4479411.1 NAD-dependent epimerase/dehydratase family protein [Demequina sp. EGI L300058]